MADILSACRLAYVPSPKVRIFQDLLRTINFLKLVYIMTLESNGYLRYYLGAVNASWPDLTAVVQMDLVMVLMSLCSLLSVVFSYTLDYSAFTKYLRILEPKVQTSSDTTQIGLKTTLTQPKYSIIINNIRKSLTWLSVYSCSLEALSTCPKFFVFTGNRLWLVPGFIASLQDNRTIWMVSAISMVISISFQIYFYYNYLEIIAKLEQKSVNINVCTIEYNKLFKAMVELNTILRAITGQRTVMLTMCMPVCFYPKIGDSIDPIFILYLIASTLIFTILSAEFLVCNLIHKAVSIFNLVSY